MLLDDFLKVKVHKDIEGALVANRALPPLIAGIRHYEVVHVKTLQMGTVFAPCRVLDRHHGHGTLRI